MPDDILHYILQLSSEDKQKPDLEVKRNRKTCS